MDTAHAPSPRASLLAGLRTGGVRSASSPMGNVPHTAAPGGSFNVPRFLPQTHDTGIYPQEDDEDELSNMMQQNLYINNNVGRLSQQPMTAAVDGANNRFAQHQAMGMLNAGNAFNPLANVSAQTQLQAMQQFQMMQMEIVRLQVRNCYSRHDFAVIIVLLFVWLTADWIYFVTSISFFANIGYSGSAVSS